MQTPKPRRLEVWAYRLPLRIRFEHAAAGRDESEGVLVRLELTDGSVGWGEGIPRDYVTGETVESAVAMIDEAYARRLASGSPLDMAPVESDGVHHNAAWCACELAWLDAVGRSRRQRAALLVAEVLGLEPGGRLRASSMVLSAGSLAKLRRRLRLARLWNFRDYKLKVGRDADHDEAALDECVRRLGRGLGCRRTLRADANGAWTLEDAVRRCESLAAHRVAAIEQPLARGDEAALPELRRRTNVPVMLDESLLSPDQAARLAEAGAVDLLNLRVSKNGGLVQTLRMARMADRLGLGFQLGCMVGETGVLTAAGRVFLELMGEQVKFAEGSYGRLLLRQDVTRERLLFGYGGRVRAMRGPGLGVEVRPEAVERVARRALEIAY